MAERKVLTLLDYDARINIVADEVTPNLSELAKNGRLNFRQGTYRPSDLTGVRLVIAATNQKELNRQIAKDCFKNNILVNVVDDPEYSNFLVPAVVKRGFLQIAVSTSGKSPLLAKKIKEELETLYGPAFGWLVSFLGEVRQKAINEVADPGQRQSILTRLVDLKLLQLVREEKLEEAKERLTLVYRNGRD
ncbi:MAG: bifunctional precorrin-2 dehydrogenase/sirohydrochlorin ferrochelatase [Peptococcaceae bacterium]